MKKIMTFIIAAVVVAADQLVKILVINQLKPIRSVTVIEGLLNFTYVENKGMAFGMLANQRWIFIALTSVVILALIVAVLKLKNQSNLFYISAALLIGGGIGNMIDRILYGYVVDYIQLSFFPPVCNFADYCVTAGVIIFLIYLFFFTDFLKSDKEKRIDKNAAA
ncbi:MULTISPECIES: signal peptidase II [unclassified Ruminococcus]|uniref:signal peptidase II n=1 Tax=unclassified Ruminococcus TaxID=2608920 RepID=UPI00210933EB|nr:MULTISPECIES: signal peptidase II [unclassified Ruminococcus]